MDRVRTGRILKLAAPVVGGMVSQNVLNLVDTAMVGRLGVEALAGVGLASFAFFMSFAAITGLSSAVQAMSARRLGEGNDERAAAALHEGLLVALLVGVPLSVLFYFAAPFFFPALIDDPAVQDHAVPYYRARLVAMVAVGANFAFRGFWNGVNRPGLYFRTLVTMHVVNVVVSYALIFGVWGAPELGSTGAGLGTALATWVGTGMYVWLGITHGRGFGFLSKVARPAWSNFSVLLRIALPTAVQQFLFAAGFTAMLWILGRIGTAEVAVAQVLVNVTLVALLPGIGLGLVATSLVGQALGRKDPADARAWGWDVVKVGILALAVLGLPMWIAPEAVLGVFLPDDPAAVALGRPALRLVGLSIWLDGVGLILMNALLGAGDARTAAAISISMQWGLFLPAAYLVGPVLGWGLLGVWMAQVVQRSLQALVFARIWQRGAWAGIEV